MYIKLIKKIEIKFLVKVTKRETFIWIEKYSYEE